MALREELQAELGRILAQQWNVRDGSVVPSTDSVTLSGGGVKLDAVMLYADLADSTKLAINFDRRVAAKVVKGFLSACCRIIRANRGHIRSFDGDRVMAVFLEGAKNTNAVKSAMMINWVVQNALRPQIHAKYPKLAVDQFEIRHGVGIDRSDVLVVRSGIRNHNDLIWIGRAPNVAAKLANFRESVPTYITDTVFRALLDEGKFGGNPRRLMWESRTWRSPPSPGVTRLHRSGWTWTPP